VRRDDGGRPSESAGTTLAVDGMTIHGIGLRGAGRSAMTLALAGMVIAAATRRRERFSLEGRTVLVTGGSRGLGYLIARECARRGARIAICARDLPELERARAALAREGHRITAVACDVADRAAVTSMVDEVTRMLGGIDVLVNNAGIIEVGPLETMTMNDFERAMNVMFWGMLHTTTAVVPQMRARGEGQIVNVASIGGRLAIPHLTPYSAAKFAAVGLSEGLHAELAASGIRVLTVTPGLMRTGSHLQARFKGRPRAEYAWFALGATLPMISMDAERAARKIVAAMQRGATDLVLGLPAKVAALAHGVAPGATASALALVNRLLPAADGADRSATPGDRVDREVRRPVFRALTRLGRTAAARFQHRPLRRAV
jgi:short-subunit dehydrogenase